MQSSWIIVPVIHGRSRVVHGVPPARGQTEFPRVVLFLTGRCPHRAGLGTVRHELPATTCAFVSSAVKSSSSSDPHTNMRSTVVPCSRATVLGPACRRVRRCVIAAEAGTRQRAVRVGAAEIRDSRETTCSCRRPRRNPAFVCRVVVVCLCFRECQWAGIESACGGRVAVERLRIRALAHDNTRTRPFARAPGSRSRRACGTCGCARPRSSTLHRRC